MKKLEKQAIFDLINFAPLWLLLQALKILPTEARCAAMGWISRAISGLIAERSKNVDKNLSLIYPDMTAEARRDLRRKIFYHTGRVGCSMVNAKGCSRLTHRLHASGAGLEVMRAAQAEGRGVVLLSAHIGQWDSPRIYLRSIGIEVGAIIFPIKNRFIERYLVRNMRVIGGPIVFTGREGTIQMVRALKAGKVMAVLSDQRQLISPILPFMGFGAKTSDAPARMALKLGLPLVCVFTRVAANGRDVHIDFQAPIAHSSPEQMITEFNRRLGDKIKETPEQWHWLHDRWRV